MLHLGPIWYHSEPSDVPYSQNLPRTISWFGLFLQQNDSSRFYYLGAGPSLVLGLRVLRTRNIQIGYLITFRSFCTFYYF